MSTHPNFDDILGIGTPIEELAVPVNGQTTLDGIVGAKKKEESVTYQKLEDSFMDMGARRHPLVSLVSSSGVLEQLVKLVDSKKYKGNDETRLVRRTISEAIPEAIEHDFKDERIDLSTLSIVKLWPWIINQVNYNFQIGLPIFEAIVGRELAYEEGPKSRKELAQGLVNFGLPERLYQNPGALAGYLKRMEGLFRSQLLIRDLLLPREDELQKDPSFRRYSRSLRTLCGEEFKNLNDPKVLKNLTPGERFNYISDANADLYLCLQRLEHKLFFSLLESREGMQSSEFFRYADFDSVRDYSATPLAGGHQNELETRVSSKGLLKETRQKLVSEWVSEESRIDIQPLVVERSFEYEMDPADFNSVRVNYVDIAYKLVNERIGAKVALDYRPEEIPVVQKIGGVYCYINCLRDGESLLEMELLRGKLERSFARLDREQPGDVKARMDAIYGKLTGETNK